MVFCHELNPRLNAIICLDAIHTSGLDIAGQAHGSEVVFIHPR